jgi:nucleoside-diphosphate-sugar epimerase
VSIGELAALIAELAGKPGLPIVTDAVRVRPEGSEVFELVADAHRAAELTGWRPEVSLRDGLRQAIEFVRNHPDAYDPDRYAT